MRVGICVLRVQASSTVSLWNSCQFSPFNPDAITHNTHSVEISPLVPIIIFTALFISYVWIQGPIYYYTLYLVIMSL